MSDLTTTTPITRKRMIAECDRELEMRRKVWKRLPGKRDEFLSDEHQRQYATLCAIRDILEMATEDDIKGIAQRYRQRIEKEAADRAAQQTLFQTG